MSDGSAPHGSLNLLVDCLEQVPSLGDLGTRRLCLELLAEHGVTLVVDEFGTARRHLFGILIACRRQQPWALSAFLDVVEQLEPGSVPVQRARAVVREMTALDLMAEPECRELVAALHRIPGDRLAEFVRAAAGQTAEMSSLQYYPAVAAAISS